MDRAERRGLVERTVSLSDRRGFNVKLTAAGRELADQVGQEIGRQTGALLGSLDVAEQAQLTALAAKIFGAPLIS
ncbi:transcriptional repressor MprA [compost metagenome]